MSEHDEDIEDVWVAAPASQGALVSFQSSGVADAYVTRSQMVIVGAFDVVRFQDTLRTLLQRQPILRSSFEWEGLDHPVQVVARHAAVQLETSDLRDLSADAQQRALDRADEADRRRGFDPGVAPLVRFRLHRLADERHVLVLSLFHGLLDGWSVSLVLDELAALYEGRPLPPPAPYAPYASWLVERDRTRDEAYWRARLSTGSLDGGLHLGRRGRGHGRWRSVERALPSSLTERLDAAIRTTRTTLATWVSLAWGIVLARYGDTRDVVFGMTFSHRPAEVPRVEEIVGALFNTVPFRLALGDDLRVEDAVQRTFAALVEDARHGQLEPAAIHRVSGRPSGRELFDTAVRVQTLPQSQRKTALTIESQKLDDPWHYTACLVVSPAEDAITLRLDFDDGRLAPGLATSALRHVAHVLDSLLSATRLGEIGLLDREEEEALVRLVASAPTAETPSSPRTLLERAADERPNDTVLVWEGTPMTCGELERRANQIAHVLLARGVGPEHVVAMDVMLAARPLDMTIVMLGIWKAGGAILGLDPRSPPERLRLLLASLSEVTHVGDARIAQALGLQSTLTLDALLAEAATASTSRTTNPILPSALGAVIPTSGSSGTPNAVMITHAFVHARRLTDPHDSLSPRRGERTSSEPPVYSVLLALDLGTVAVIEPLQLVWDGEVYAKFVTAHGIQTVGMSPSHLSAVEPAMFPTMRVLSLGSEPIPPAIVDKWLAHYRVYGQYQATEIVYGTRGEFLPAHREEPSVGRPTRGIRMHVVDSSMRLVPPGVEGEVVFGEPLIARGYLGHPALTAQRFVPDPRSPGRRMFRTGDRGRLYEDGRLELLGRRDTQVKLRGFRVELGEVEAVLADVAGVKRIAVVKKRHPRRGDTLVAYLEGTAKPDDLRAWARKRLPEYMHPGHYVTMASLPMLQGANLKVSRSELPDPVWDTEVTGSSSLSPMERDIAAVFAEVLGVQDVSRDESFFELGGHSLLAMQVISKLRAKLRIALSLRTLFESPTVAGLAAQIGAQTMSVDVPLVPVDRSGDLPLSLGQEVFWRSATSTEYGNVVGMLAFGLRFKGALRVDVLEAALSEIVVRQEALRTSFTSHDGRPVQRVLPATPVKLTVEELEPGADLVMRVRARVTEQTAVPLDRERGELMKLSLFRIAPDDHALIVVGDHLVFDGWSIFLFGRELKTIYGAYSRGEPSPLPPLAIQIGDFAAWQRKIFDEPAFEKERQYWRDLLGDAPREVALPADRPRSSHTQNWTAVTVDDARATKYRAAAPALGGLFAMFWTGLVTMLYEMSGQTDLVIGTFHANRMREEIFPVMSSFANLVVARAKLASGEPLHALHGRLRGELIEILEHSDLPQRAVLDAVKPPPTTERQPLCNVIYQLADGVPEPVVDGPQDLSIEHLNVSVELQQKADFFIGVDAGVEGKMRVRIAFKGHFDRSTVDRLIEQWLVGIDALVDTPERVLIA